MRLPFITRTLPEYTGPHTVGFFDVEIPLKEARHFGEFRSTATDQVGLSVNTVLFSLFYPAVKGTGTSHGVSWIPRPFGATIDGFLKFSNKQPGFVNRAISYPLSAAFVGGTTLPAEKAADLLPPSDQSSWPCVIFSHGLAGTRLLYSQYCGELASRGYVVAAVEHRDGSGPSTSVRNADGTVQIMDWLDHKDLQWPDNVEQPTDGMPLRKEQLKVRLAEVEEVMKALNGISTGDSTVWDQSLVKSITRQSFDYNAWGRVNTAAPLIAGHSFGGATLFSALQDSRFSFTKGVALDPWLEPLERGNAKIDASVLVIDSENFTVWLSHFATLRALLKRTANSVLTTIAGATHTSFSDLHLILPSFANTRSGLKADPARVMSLAVENTVAFFTGARDKIIESGTSLQDQSPKRPLAEPGTLVIHDV